MAKKKTTASPNDSWRKRRAAALTMLDEMEALPTMKMQLLANGMTIGVERDSVWAFGKVPTGPVEDAKDDKQKLEAYRPIYAMFDQLAKATPIGAIKRRSVTKSAYRHFQIKRINMHSRWKALDTRAPADRRWHQQRLDEHLYASFAPTMMNDVVLAFGVKLEPKAMGSSWQAAWESTKFTLFEGGVPLVDYERDLEKVSAMFSRAGLGELTPKEVRKLDSWWNAGKNPDVPYLPHEDHIHLFRDYRSMRTARQMGPADCSRWSEGLPGHRIVSFGTLEELELNFYDPLERVSNWLLSSMNAGALAVSIRGQVEPARMTQHALRSNRSAYRNDIRERRAQGKLSRADEEDRLSELTEVEGYYSKGQGSPTLMNTSVLAAFDGLVEDFETLDHGLASWLPMENRQSKAWVEMMITSMRRANPYLHDLPAQVAAASGINSVSRVGDDFGILRGFTEADGLPSRYSVEAAYSAVDRSPTTVAVSGSGGGKTTMMQWEAYQTAMLKYPQIVLDFKRKSDLTPVFNRIPGSQTFNLSELGSADGAFDSMLYSESPRDGISMAVDNIRYVDPYSNPAKSSAMEPDLFAALDFAVTQMADRENRVGTLGALRYAHEHGQLADEHMAAIEKISTMPGFTALCGTGESGSLLSKEGVTTLIKIGDGGMKLPSVGSPPTTMVERINVTLVKNVAFAATAALADHKGVLRVDEAWVLTSHVPDDLKELGRVARSQNIDITLYTQEISDALNAGLGNYLTRGVILHIPDESEATAACQLFGLDPTEERIRRITNPGGDASSLDGAGNAGMDYNSLKAIKDPETGVVQRGAVGIDIDVRGRAVPVEVRIPESLLPIISTNVDDVGARGDGESKPDHDSEDSDHDDEQVVSDRAAAR